MTPPVMLKYPLLGGEVHSKLDAMFLEAQTLVEIVNFRTRFSARSN